MKMYFKILCLDVAVFKMQWKQMPSHQRRASIRLSKSLLTAHATPEDATCTCYLHSNVPYHLDGNLSYRLRCLPIFAKGLGLDSGSASAGSSNCTPDESPLRRFSFLGLLWRIILSAKSLCSMAANSREFLGDEKLSVRISLILAAFLRGDFI